MVSGGVLPDVVLFLTFFITLINFVVSQVCVCYVIVPKVADQLYGNYSDSGNEILTARKIDHNY